MSNSILEQLGQSHASNVRKSFFGGVVSTRLKAQNLAGIVIPKEVKKVDATKQKGRGGASKDAPASKPAVRPAFDKEAARRAAAAKSAALREKLKQAQEDDDLHVPATGLVLKQKPSAAAALKRGQSASKASAEVNAKLKAAAESQVLKRGRRPETIITSSGQKVVSHNAVARPAKRQALAAPRPKYGLANAVPSFPARAPTQKKPRPPKDDRPRKQCRDCTINKLLTEYFVDKRLSDGLMHICSTCAQKQSLSGRLYTGPSGGASQPPKATPAAAARPPSAATSGAKEAAGGARRVAGALGVGKAASRPDPAALAAAARKAGFYNGSVRKAPAVSAVRNGSAGMRRRPDLDDYEDDGFVETDDEEDWRAALAEETRRFYHEDRDEDYYNDRMMEATREEMMAEERRSRIAGRREDEQAARELETAAEAKQQRKKAKKKKKRKKSSTNMFIDDECSEDSDEDDE